MKLNLKSRLRLLISGNIDEYRESFFRGDDIGTMSIDTETAMKYSAVSACVRVRGETFASVPAVLYRKRADGRDPVNDIALYDILHNRPNEEMAPFAFKETMLSNFDISGNSVCEKLVNSAGELVGLYPYRHEAVSIKRSPDTKKLIYEITGGTNTRTLQRNQVLHVPNLSFDGIVGLSPITYAASAIRLGLSYEEYGVKFYKNAATPSGVFEHPETLSEESFVRLKKDLNESYSGLKNTGKPMILEGGMKWAQTTINPIDAQLLESKYFQIEDICRIYRVPQHLINKLDRSTFNNIEHQSLEFVMYTMLPIFKRFEDNINMQLLTPAQRKAGYYVEFKIDGLLRGDAKSRAEAYAVGRQWGWLSANDIRRLENQPTIGTQGDVYLSPSNMVDSANLSEQSAQVNARLVDDMYKLLEERR